MRVLKSANEVSIRTGMNNIARSIKTATILAALALGLAQFFIAPQPQAAPPLTLSPQFASVSCGLDFCSVNPEALVAGLDHPNSISFDGEGVTLYLYDRNGRPTGEVAVFTQKGATVPLTAMTTSDKPCTEICPGVCKSDMLGIDYCHITF